MSLPTHYTRIVLNERPTAEIVSSTFRTERVPFDLEPTSHQVLVNVLWLSLDPAMRGYLNDVRSYMPPVQINEVMRAYGIATVLRAGPQSKFRVGQTVEGSFGWTEYAVLDDKNVFEVVPPPGAEPLDFLNTLGTSGLTAYFGIVDILQLKPGETLVVSGAAGSVGAVACQLGKQIGAKVYAIAGSKDKCKWLEKDLGVDKALSYKDPDFRKVFRKIGFVDAYFDNVGGEILDLVLTRLNKDARIALCGAISAYNGVQYGLKNYVTLISQRAKVQGFIIFDYVKRWPEAREAISKAHADGSIKRRFHVIEGLEKAPAALPMLFRGENTGKLVVKVSDDERTVAKAKL